MMDERVPGVAIREPAFPSGHAAGCICNGTGVVPDRPWQAMRRIRTSLVPQPEGYHRRALPCPGPTSGGPDACS